MWIHNATIFLKSVAYLRLIQLLVMALVLTENPMDLFEFSIIFCI